MLNETDKILHEIIMDSNDHISELWNLFESLRAKGQRFGIDTVALLSAFLYIRWLDRYDTEQEAIAAFEERDYEPALAWQIRWNELKKISFHELEEFYESRLAPALKKWGNTPHSQSLARIGQVMDHFRFSNSPVLLQLIRFIDHLPFETPDDFRKAGEIIEIFLQKVNRSAGRYAGEFSTPGIVAELMAELADPKPGERVYDPCFGTGGILLKCADRMREQAGQMPPRVWAQVRDGSIFGIEQNQVSYIVGLARLVLAGIDNPGLELGNTLERADMSNRSTMQFDCVLANPPWGAKVPDEIQSHFSIKTSDTIGLFIQHITSVLKAGGRAAVIVPSGFLFKTGPDRRIRKKLLERFRIEGVISLPKGTWMPHTGIESNILLIRKDKPAGQVRFMRVPELESRNRLEDSSSIKKEALTITAKFRSNKINSVLWETSVTDLGKRDWDLQVRRSGDDQLEKFLRSLQEVEEDIRLEPLNKIAEVRTGFSYSKEVVTEEKSRSAIPLVRVADISVETIHPPGLFLLDKAKDRVSDKNLRVKSGDILVSASGTIGKVGIINEKLADAVPAKSIITIRAKENLLPEYLHALFMSGPYQDWIKGHARGSTIQHLSVRTLRHLTVPVPEVQVQERIYKTWKNQGGDPSGILLRTLSGVDMHPVISWLESAPEVVALLKGKKFESRNDRLILLEKFIREITKQRNNAVHEHYKDLPGDVMTWLLSIEIATSNLLGINDTPLGTAKYSMLDSARLSIQNAAGSLQDTALPVMKTIRTLCRNLEELILAEIESMLSFDGFEVRIRPDYVRTGRETEASLFIKNPGAFIFKDLKVRTRPDFGKLDKKYMAEKEEILLTLHLPAQVAQGRVDFLIQYTCKRLDGKEIQGEIPYSVEIKSTRESLHAVDMGPSPYNGQDAVRRKEMFFGRENILDRIYAHLTKLHPAGVILVEGNRRTGKTSILNRIRDDDRLTGTLIVFCDLQGGKGEQQAAGISTGEIFRLIAREIGYLLYDFGIETWLHNVPPRQNIKPFKKEFKDSTTPAFSGENPFETFEAYLEDVLKSIHPKRLLIMLDEFDRVQEGIDAGITSPVVPENLRYLIQNYKAVSIMLVGSRRLKHLRSRYWSALFGLGESIIVGPLEPKGAERLVIEPVRDRLSYVPEAKDKIVWLCARRANLIQKMCDHLFYMAKNQGERIITLNMVEKAAKELTDDNEHFATLWEENCRSERQRFILTICARMNNSEELVTFLTLEEGLREYGVPVSGADRLEDDIEFLVEMELIERFSESGKDQYRISIPMMAEWLRHVDFDIQLRKAIREGEAR